MRRSKWTARLVVLFAVASGLGAFAPPAAATFLDDYAEPYQVNSPGTTLPRDVTLGYSNSGMTLQQDEPHDCDGVDYGATMWAELYPDRPGALELRGSGSGFDMALSVMRFAGSSFTGISERECTTSIFQLGEFTHPRTLQEGQGYKIQLGGVGGGTGSFTVRLIFHPDSDRDGVLDRDDRCPATGGPDAGKFNGCPDTDGDGVPDLDDRCAANAGRAAAAHQGCPDTDGDGFPDIDDRCPADNGSDTAKFTGCPDNDQDGVPEGSGGTDGCSSLNARNPMPGILRNDQKEPFGCPDTLLLHNLVKADRAFFKTPSGILMDSFAVTGVPNGTRVSVICRLPNHRPCADALVRRARRSRINIGSLDEKRLPFGTTITVRATAPFATGKFILVKVVNTRARVVQVNRCMNASAPRRLRRSGCS